MRQSVIFGVLGIFLFSFVVQAQSIGICEVESVSKRSNDSVLKISYQKEYVDEIQCMQKLSAVCNKGTVIMMKDIAQATLAIETGGHFNIAEYPNGYLREYNEFFDTNFNFYCVGRKQDIPVDLSPQGMPDGDTQEQPHPGQSLRPNIVPQPGPNVLERVRYFFQAVLEDPEVIAKGLYWGIVFIIAAEVGLAVLSGGTASVPAALSAIALIVLLLQNNGIDPDRFRSGQNSPMAWIEEQVGEELNYEVNSQGDKQIYVLEMQGKKINFEYEVNGTARLESGDACKFVSSSQGPWSSPQDLEASLQTCQNAEFSMSND